MKKILLTSLTILSTFSFSQKRYSKISNADINQERMLVGKNFITEFINKCKNKDYIEFKNFILDKRISSELYKRLPETCEANGEMEILKFNSAYNYTDTQYDDPVNLFIFDFKTEKLPLLKYVSVWVYEDKNVIGSIYISKEKPIYKKKKTVSKL